MLQNWLDFAEVLSPTIKKTHCLSYKNEKKKKKNQEL